MLLFEYIYVRRYIMSTPIENYLASCGNKPNPAMLSYVANLQQTAAVAPDIASSVVNELENQRSHLKLVASENYCSLKERRTMSSNFYRTDNQTVAQVNVCVFRSQLKKKLQEDGIIK